MKVAKIAVVLSVALGVSGPALAQQVGAIGAIQVWKIGPTPDQVASGNYTPDDDVAWKNELTGVGVARPTPIQYTRARKAAALINADRCSEAHQLALKAKDDKLASRVAEVCAAR